ncbi:DUF2160 family membrane protein [Vibrio sinaloensis]|nr:DUF2160 family membrane protein [Vibrio sinaloensis]
MSSAFIHLGFVGLTELSIWVPFTLSVIWLSTVLKWG